MSLSDNHMDDLFRERLGSFSPEPPPGAWNRIQEELDRKRNVRRMIYYRWAGAAAVLLIAIVSGILIPTQKDITTYRQDSEKITALPKAEPDNPPANPPTNQVAAMDVPTLKPDKGKKTRVTGNTETYHPAPEIPRENYLPVLFDSDQQVNRPEIASATTGEVTLVFTPGNTMILALSPDHTSKRPFEPDFPEVKKKPAAPPEWKIGIRLTPAFDSQSADYSASYAQNLSSSGSTGQTGMGGGISVKVKTSRRWMIESGLYYSRSDINPSRNTHLFAANADYFSLASADKSFSSNQVTLVNGRMSVNSRAGVIRIDQVPEKAKLVAGAETAIGMNTILLTSGDFSQVFDFLELPLTARYRIYEGKIDIELQSGLSANFVIGNQVFIANGSQREYVGKTGDIAQLGFSGIAGLGFNYPISKRMAISIEPRASYWLNSLNNGGEVTFKPWRIGIYSGLTFGF